MAAVTFTFNIAFTLPVNDKSDVNSPVLTAGELWQGIKRGGRHPHDFADYVASCTMLSGSRNQFRRRLTLADGAVHTAAGVTLDQDVVIADGLQVEATTVDTGARSTFLMASGADDGHNETDLFLTASYELKLHHVMAGTQEARDIEANYTALARGACRGAVDTIRQWKVMGKLAQWAREDEVLDATGDT